MIEKFFSSHPIELSDEETSRIQVLRTGTFIHKRYGKFSITEDTLGEIVANFEEDRVPLDYNHGGLEKDPDKSKAAGWTKSLSRDEGKLYANVSFTPQAREYIKNQEFKYISPEFSMAHTDPESGENKGAKLAAVALTNRPFLPGMSPVTLNADDGTWFGEDAEWALKDKRDNLTMLLGEASLTERVEAVASAFHTMYRDSGRSYLWTEDVRDNNIIVRQSGEGPNKFWKIGYKIDGDEITFDARGEWAAVRRTYTPISNSKTSRSKKMNEKEIRERLKLAEDQDVGEHLDTLIKANDDFTEENKTLKADKETADSDLEKANSDKDAAEKKLTETEATLKTTQESLETAKKDEDGQVKVLNERIDGLTKDKLTLTNRVETNENELKQLTDDKKDRECSDRIKAAMEAGKLTAAECEDVDGKPSALKRLAREEPDTFKEIIDRRPANEKLTKVISTTESDDDDLDSGKKFWKFVEEKQAEHPDKPEHEIREIVCAEHPEIAKIVFKLREED